MGRFIGILFGAVIALFYVEDAIGSYPLRLFIVFLGLVLIVAICIFLATLPRRIKLAMMIPAKRDAFLAAEEEARRQAKEAERQKENLEREKQYLDAIAGPRKWCLMAMREGRNYTRQRVHKNDVDDVLAWASANDIAVTEMDQILDDVKLSFGELRRAKKTARFMGEPV